MKKLLVTMAVAITGVVQAFALTPTAIRENARFLTDRMAYELNLTPQQYEDCYEINYDFIASINPFMDEVVYGYPEYIDRYYNFLDYRNDDLRYIMTEAQYLAFVALDYFYRPIYTHAGNWLFRIYQYYSNTRFFYYDPPLIYHSYFGGHGRHYFPHGYYGGGRYSHHVYARPRPVHRRGGRHDFGPRASYRPRHYAPHHVPPTRHERTSPGRNDHHRGNDHGINHRDNAGRGNDHGSRGRGNDRGNGGRDNDNHRGNDRGNGSHGGMGQGGNGSHGSHGGANQGGSNGRSNRDGVNRGGGSNRPSHVKASNESRQMRQQSSGRTERVQSNVQRGASNATRAGSASHMSGGSHRSGGSHSSGSHSGGSRGGSSHGGGSNGGGHRR